MHTPDNPSSGNRGEGARKSHVIAEQILREPIPDLKYLNSLSDRCAGNRIDERGLVKHHQDCNLFLEKKRKWETLDKSNITKDHRDSIEAKFEQGTQLLEERFKIFSEIFDLKPEMDQASTLKDLSLLKVFREDHGLSTTIKRGDLKIYQERLKELYLKLKGVNKRIRRNLESIFAEQIATFEQPTKDRLH